MKQTKKMIRERAVLGGRQPKAIKPTKPRTKQGDETFFMAVRRALIGNESSRVERARQYFKISEGAYASSRNTPALGGRDVLAEDFATLYASIRLAQAFGLAPAAEGKRMLALLLECEAAYRDFKTRAAKAASVDLGVALSRLRGYLWENRDALLDIRRDLLETKPKNCAGYLAHHEGRDEILITNPVFEKIAGSKRLANALKKALKKAGQIATAGAGDRGTTFSVKRQVWKSRSGHRQYFVAISASMVPKPKQPRRRLSGEASGQNRIAGGRPGAGAKTK